MNYVAVKKSLSLGCPSMPYICNSVVRYCLMSNTYLLCALRITCQGSIDQEKTLGVWIYC